MNNYFHINLLFFSINHNKLFQSHGKNYETKVASLHLGSGLRFAYFAETENFLLKVL